MHGKKGGHGMIKREGMKSGLYGKEDQRTRSCEVRVRAIGGRCRTSRELLLDEVSRQ